MVSVVLGVCQHHRCCQILWLDGRVKCDWVEGHMVLLECAAAAAAVRLWEAC